MRNLHVFKFHSNIDSCHAATGALPTETHKKIMWLGANMTTSKQRLAVIKF